MGKAAAGPDPIQVTRRPATPDDASFLYEVYAASRAEEMARVPWTEAEKEAFLRQQFQAQDTHYHRHYPEAAFDIVLADGARAGRLYIDHAAYPDEIRILDIALLPEFRNRGIGTRLLRAVLDEAAASGRVVRLHVEFYNPAQRLYARLGFRSLRENGPYVFMEWRPEVPGG